MLFISMDHLPAIVSPASKAVRPSMTESWLDAPKQRTATVCGWVIYDNNILPRLIMIMIKIIFLYFIEIAHTDDSPSTGTRLVLIIRRFLAPFQINLKPNQYQQQENQVSFVYFITTQSTK